ncbi:uncharacterized protein LOC126417053 [Schistocerca serialis cubense]|uniref:uncharacterized protein LOC126417053 n=1 Tax=Schistocerca serialis cubense TaxID=2023355 RepID=UPI00214EC08C|nr:uncharacterized protein LOC126417053 [Schistocerca serialis cubense]
MKVCEHHHACTTAATHAALRAGGGGPSRLAGSQVQRGEQGASPPARVAEGWPPSTAACCGGNTPEPAAAGLPNARCAGCIKVAGAGQKLKCRSLPTRWRDVTGRCYQQRQAQTAAPGQTAAESGQCDTFSSSPSPGPSDRHVPPSQSPTDGTDVPPDNLAAEQAPAPDAEETSTSSQHLFDNFIVPTDAFEPGRRSSLPSSDTEEHVRKQRSPRRRKRRRRSPTGSQSVATRDDEDDTQAADISTQRSADNFHDEQDVSQDGTTMEVATHNVTIGAPVETPVSPPTTPDLSHHDAIPMDIGQTHGTGAWADDIEEGTPPPPDELPPPDEATC